MWNAGSPERKLIQVNPQYMGLWIPTATGWQVKRRRQRINHVPYENRLDLAHDETFTIGNPVRWQHVRSSLLAKS